MYKTVVGHPFPVFEAADFSAGVVTVDFDQLLYAASLHKHTVDINLLYAASLIQRTDFCMHAYCFIVDGKLTPVVLYTC